MQHAEKVQVYKKGCIYCAKVVYLCCIEITQIKHKYNADDVLEMHFVAYA